MINLHDSNHVRDCVKALFVPYIRKQGGDSIAPVVHDWFQGVSLRSITTSINDVIKVEL